MPPQMGPGGGSKTRYDIPPPTERSVRPPGVGLPQPEPSVRPLPPRAYKPRRPGDVDATRTLPDSARRFTLGGPGDVRRPPNEPFTIPVEVSAVTSVPIVWLFARRASGAGAEQLAGPAPGANVAVDPLLAQKREREDRAVANFREQLQRDTGLFRETLTALDDFLFGKVEGAAAERVVGGGAVGRKAGGLFIQDLLSGGALGAGEEDEIARRNEALKDARRRSAELLLSLLRLSPPLAGGAGVLVAPPQEQADP